MLMSRKSCLVFSLLLGTAAWADDLTEPSPAKSLAFAGLSIDGTSVKLERNFEAELTVVCFMGVECPLAKLYAPRLNTCVDEYQARVRFVGVNSNLQDSAEDIGKFHRENELRFPIIKDVGNVIADQFGAQRTPEVFVVDRNLTIRYRGRIDDQYLPGISRTTPQRQELRIAIDQLLAGDAVTVAETEAVGCLIGRVKTPIAESPVTYCDQVSRILQKNCLECHRSGEIGPFSMSDYDEVVGWADMILEVVEDGRMPPWHANPRVGHFANERLMSSEGKQQLREWVAAGAPFGDESDLPEPLQFTDGWQLPRQPDKVFVMRDRPFVVPADGTVEYQYFVVDPGFEEDQWVTAAQVVPGNRAVVHHSIVFIRPPDGARFRGVGWLAAYVPGQRVSAFSSSRGRLVPAGSKLVFQQHYTPTGREESDQTKVGIVFGKDQDITHEAYTLVGIDQEFEIPPGAADYPVESKVRWLPKNGQLLAIIPHMHLRGKTFCLYGRHADQQEILLDVPKYDFNWQHTYELVDPLPLSEIDELKFRVTFDNSAQNPANPDPKEHVSWGDQTWEEMAVAFFDVSVPRTNGDDAKIREIKRETESQEFTERVNEFADSFISRFDSNLDGAVGRDETPLSIRRFGFRKYDADGDGRLTREELFEVARRRIKR